MRNWIVLALGTILLACAGEGPSEPNNQKNQTKFDALAEQIEAKVAATHPEIDLSRLARHYAKTDGGNILGVYLFANKGYEPLKGRAGEVFWQDEDSLPAVLDGGCSVINIVYHEPTETLVSVYCNGDA